MGQGRPFAKIALIVEDDADQRALIAALLRNECGLDILECESAEAALATMLLRGREVSLVFSDLRLSGVMDGIDLARELRMRWPHLTVVMTSGNPGTRLVHLPPGVKFVAKPWTATDICLAAAPRNPAGTSCEPTSGRHNDRARSCVS
jgi:CheY-like chemotaxis protein